MKRFYKADYCFDQINDCCGVAVCSDFRIEEITEEYKKRYLNHSYYRYDEYKHESSADAWKGAFEEIINADLKNNDGSEDWEDREAWTFQRPIQFWFMKPKNSEAFQHDELRQLVLAHESQVYLGTFINPNTGNTIEGYMLKHNVKEIK